MFTGSRSRYRSVLTASLSVVVFAAISAATPQAQAHFLLDSPESYMSQNILGDPQKAPPCGDDGSGTLTGAVTSFKAGDTITITISETIYHPGHYRVALAPNDVSELPAEPIVTPGTTDCGSAEIMDPPVYPVLADGELVHSSAFSGAQSFQVKLPDNVTCENCTLQIIQFMAEHGLNNPGGCFYHHCANISISADTSTGGTGGMSTGGSGGVGGSNTAGSNSGATGGAGGSHAGSDHGGSTNSGGSGGSGGNEAQVAPTNSDDGGCSMSSRSSSAFGPAVFFGLMLALFGRRPRKESQRSIRQRSFLDLRATVLATRIGFLLAVV